MGHLPSFVRQLDWVGKQAEVRVQEDKETSLRSSFSRREGTNVR